MGTKVKLRQKQITGNRQSLYLDFYPPIRHPKTGKLTRREFLGMYIFIDKDYVKKEIQKKKKSGDDISILSQLYKTLKPLTPVDKQHNNETMQLAEQIRQKQENFINKPEIYNEYEKKQLRIKELGEKSFSDYFRKLANKRKASNYDNWVSALNHFNYFVKSDIKFEDLSESFIEDFKEYLLSANRINSETTKISQNTALSYFNKVKATLRQAYRDGYLQEDLNSKISPIKESETHREYLTLEELNKLVKTPCCDYTIKRAGLFSALTGLRFSDLHKLVWGEIVYNNGQGYFIKFKQKKTKGAEVLPISQQAYSLLGSQNDSTEKVFTTLKYTPSINDILSKWIKAAGIPKHITFHCFRHTYAVLQLANGTDIYTVSKMLGHRDLKTTQVYAKIVDEAKREATNRINLNF